MARNGELPRSALKPITIAADGRQAYLRADAAEMFNAMVKEGQDKFGITLRATSWRTAYRNIKEQWGFWNLYRSGRGALAAKPGTSNHGLGIAIDVPTMAMRKIIDKIGAKYGFAKRWSDAPSEWWHIRFNPAMVTSAARKLAKKSADKLVQVGFKKPWPSRIRKFDDYTDRKVHKATRVWLRSRLKAKLASERRKKNKNGNDWSRIRTLKARVE